jgi:hypothetical protein
LRSQFWPWDTAKIGDSARSDDDTRRSVNLDVPGKCVGTGGEIAQFANKSIIEPVGSPLVSVSFTKGMIAADFLGDPTGTRIGHALSNTSGGLTAGTCGPFIFGCNSAHGARRFHGSTKLAGEGRLWTMRFTALISIVAQSLYMAVILTP